MRRTYISPEFQYIKVNGSLNMKEQSTFFGSKMIKIEDSISILNENIVWYQLPNGEQINSESELSLSQVVLDTVLEKLNGSKLIIDNSQTEFQKFGNTKWILDIEIQKILRNYLFSCLKRARTFEGIRNNMTLNNNVNAAIYDYIDNNILSRYRFNKIELFLKPVNLLNFGRLKWIPEFDSSIELGTTSFNKIETEVDSKGRDIRVRFTQPFQSSIETFQWYYNIYFDEF